MRRSYELFRTRHPNLLMWDAQDVFHDMEKRITALERNRDW